MGDTVLLAVTAHGIDLILHQGDKRRDDDCGTLHDARRQLVTQRFTAACRHQHECVALGQQVLDYRLLIAFKRLKTEVLLQRRYQLTVFRHNPRFRVSMILQI